MSRFAVLILCVQVCLIQSVLSCPGSGCSCGSGGYSNYGSSFSMPSYSMPSYSSNLGSSCGNYGGSGTGQVSAAGNIDACGNTCVVGAVPVQGAVSFSGCAPACGSVSISGQCGCTC